MGIEAVIVLLVIVAAIVLFVTELLPVDVVAILMMLSLVLTGVISLEEGIAGFSNPATLTVAFMFVLSAALLKTGAIQLLGLRVANVFKRNFALGMILMMLIVAMSSAFINNTPIVAVFIPVVIQIARSSKFSASKILMPLSYASIFGGTCTLIGTSTNILVSGIAVESGLPDLDMFLMTPMGLIFVLVGVLYMSLIGIRLIPQREEAADLNSQFGMHDYLTEIRILPQASAVGQKIMDAELIQELDMDIIEVQRNTSRFTLPPGDFVLQAHDVLKVRCNLEKIKQLKDFVRVQDVSPVRIGTHNLQESNSTLVEMVISANSAFIGKNLRELDFRRSYRSVPLAIRHREEILHEYLHQTRLKAGDVILAEVKSHYLKELKRREQEANAPFFLISEERPTEFRPRRLLLTLAIVLFVIVTATFKILPILLSTLVGVMMLVLSRLISMKEVYRAINWEVFFLLAGALSLGVAMRNSGLDQGIASFLVNHLGKLGPVAIISGLYLVTMLLTEVMSNNATAALLAPVAIACAASLGLSPTPFLLTIMFAASASFMTPVGYQTNTMIYSAGQYRFTDFLRVGSPLALLFWLLASLLIPVLFPF